ncbi:hypothetical protein C2G38_2138751 [Gigaspora rosea]|uniref:Uncharacterized protein n=1 Tax=Gigaspora rosea TaxID=44941 RepID=A0A397VSF3_9GLOM|nr:hypothetical protein C2G38_2138751 [Gigaspora rosea]
MPAANFFKYNYITAYGDDNVLSTNIYNDKWNAKNLVSYFVQKGIPLKVEYEQEVLNSIEFLNKQYYNKNMAKDHFEFDCSYEWVLKEKQSDIVNKILLVGNKNYLSDDIKVLNNKPLVQVRNISKSKHPQAKDFSDALNDPNIKKILSYSNVEKILNGYYKKYYKYDENCTDSSYKQIYAKYLSQFFIHEDYNMIDKVKKYVPDYSYNVCYKHNRDKLLMKFSDIKKIQINKKHIY